MDEPELPGTDQPAPEVRDSRPGPSRGPVCPVCRGRSFTLIEPVVLVDDEDPWELAFELTECGDCRLVAIRFTGPAGRIEDYTRRFHENLFDKIDQKSVAKGLKLFRDRASMFSGLPTGRLLDVGCERGFFLVTMRERGWDVEGIEPLDEFARYARDRFGAKVSTARLEDHRADVPYDLVTLWHVLEHLDDPLGALRSCRDLLAPGGLLHFEVPNVDSLGARFGGRYWMGFRDPTHRWFYRRATLERMAREAGLVVERIETAPSSGSWYSLKRALFGRLHGREHWRVEREGHRHPPGPAIRLAYAIGGFYPWLKLLSGLAARSGRGEALDVWCHRSADAG